jgi:hypothetical protein
MRSRRGGARSRASSIGRWAVCVGERLLLLRWWCYLLVKGAVGGREGQDREWTGGRVTGGGLGELYVSSDLLMCSGNGGSSGEVEEKSRKQGVEKCK